MNNPATTPIEMSNLADQLELGDHELISIAGGGGKTTIMHALGQQLPGRRILTTTTKMGSDQKENVATIVGHDIDDQLMDQLGSDGCVLTWASTDGSKAVGVTPETANRWFDMVDYVIIEADGARKKPFKAPADYEPVVPAKTTLLVSVIGSDSLDHPISDSCHRPEIVASMCECNEQDLLTPERAAIVLLHANGSLRTRPQAARFVVAITKVTPGRNSPAHKLARLVRESGTDCIVVADTNLDY